MKDSTILRTARPTEAKTISELAMRSKAYWGYSSEFMAACRDELVVTQARIMDTQRDYFVCEVDGVIVGYFAMRPISEFERDLEALFVEPQNIGFGLGRRLLEKAKEVASKRGAKILRIQSDPNAASFYAAQGAIHTGNTESGSISGRFLPEFKIELLAKSARGSIRS